MAVAATVGGAAAAAAAGSPEMGRTERLAKIALDDGTEWCDSCCDALGREGRAVAGGWPGTMSEARVRIVKRVASDPGLAATAGEMDGMARESYRVARLAWRARAVPDGVA